VSTSIVWHRNPRNVVLENILILLFKNGSVVEKNSIPPPVKSTQPQSP